MATKVVKHQDAEMGVDRTVPKLSALIKATADGEA